MGRAGEQESERESRLNSTPQDARLHAAKLLTLKVLQEFAVLI